MRQIFRNQTASIILIYVQRFESYEFSNGPLQFEFLVKKNATDQKRLQIRVSKNDLYKFDSQFNIEFHLKNITLVFFIILGHRVYISQYFPNVQ
jgi:hypothetical protein